MKTASEKILEVLAGSVEPLPKRISRHDSKGRFIGAIPYIKERACRRCGLMFRPPANHRRFCSKECGYAKKENKEIYESFFWSKVNKTDGCWEWNRTPSKSGYGNVVRRRKQISSHRASWEIHYGPIPNGLWVLHKCDNKLCVRPDHLYLGTNSDNQRDAVHRGLNTVGIRRPAKNVRLKSDKFGRYTTERI